SGNRHSQVQTRQRGKRNQVVLAGIACETTNATIVGHRLIGDWPKRRHNGSNGFVLEGAIGVIEDVLCAIQNYYDPTRRGSFITACLQRAGEFGYDGPKVQFTDK